MNSLFSNFPTKPTSQAALKAYFILCSTHDTASSFRDLFQKERTRRNAKGTPTDEEQDLLRAMLVFASSGLDSMIKQLVTDALSQVIQKDEGAFLLMQNFIEKRIKKGDLIDTKLLTFALTSHSPQTHLLSELVTTLTASSLQSKDEVLKVIAYFNIPTNKVSTDLPLLQKIFHCRNEMIHEMDIDLTQKNRSRRPRKKDDMISYTQELLRISERVLCEVDAKTKS